MSKPCPWLATHTHTYKAPDKKYMPRENKWENNFLLVVVASCQIP